VRLQREHRGRDALAVPMRRSALSG
jgi:hypothetical protein